MVRMQYFFMRNKFYLKLFTICSFLFLFSFRVWGQTAVDFSVSTTWNVPAGVTSITIECWGAGGGGHGKCTSAYPGSGGGGGSYVRDVQNVSSGQTLTITVGDGGAQATGANNASGGGYSRVTRSSPTSFSVNADGGSGATGGSISSGPGSGAIAVSGDCTGGCDVYQNGGNGFSVAGYGGSSRGGGGGGGASSSGNGTNGGTPSMANYYTGGTGASAWAGPPASYSGGTGGSCSGTSSNGTAGGVRGGGGGGGGSEAATSGGNGGAGFVRITYSVTPAPTITSFSPSSVCASSSAVVTITGTNFTNASAVSIGGTAATSYTVNSATQITATVGAGTTGVISVTTPGGTANSASNLTVNALPTLDGAFVNERCWKTDNTTDYTITIKATGSSPTDFDGSTYGMLALINYQGTRAGNHGGYYAWNSTAAALNSIGYTKNQMACTGGGFVGMYDDVANTFGDNTATLISASTSVSGNTRTVNFVVRPNNTFPQFSDNSISQYAQTVSGCTAGWTETGVNRINSTSSAPSSVSAGVTTSPVCAGNSIALQGAGTGATSWSWIGPNSFTSSLEDPTITSALTAASGTYFLTPSNTCGTGAGLFDDFSDNNFTSGPAWSPQTTTVLTTWASNVGYLQGANDYSQEVISTPSTQAFGSWKFDFTMAAINSTNHIVSFKFISTNAALSGDGYHVTIRGNATASSSTIELRRFSGVQNPTAAGNTLLGASYNWIGANTSAHTILVTRSSSGVFNVYLDGTSIITSSADLTYTSSSHAGFWTNSTAASTNHIMDNIICSNLNVDVTVNNPSPSTTLSSGDYVWRGVNSTDWSSAGNWVSYSNNSYSVPANAPLSTSNVVIPVNTTNCNVPHSVNTGTLAVNCNNINIESGATLTMGSGTINVTGNFTNNGTFNCGTGTVVFNGTAAQSINSGNASIVFNNLTINKNTGDLTLNKTTEINSTLTFTKGLINSSTSNLLVFNNNASATSAGANSYAAGPVRKVGNQAFTFPVGKSGKYAPIGISAPSVTTDHFTAEYFADDPNSVNYLRSSMESGIQTVSACEYWILDKTNGNSGVNVTLSWDVNARSCGITQPSELRVLRWESTNGGIWQDKSNTSFSSNYPYSTGSITSGQISSFSPFTLGSTTSNNPLPVALSHFSANCIQDYVKLNWATQSEINNDYFDVERSADGIDFNAIAKINGNGTTNQPNNYQFLDEQPLSGINYYRLKQVDFNGAFETYPITAVTCDAAEHVHVYPNPNNGSFSINGLHEGQEIELTDALGKIILKQKVNENSFNYQVNEVQEGIYFLLIKNTSGLMQTQKIIIKN